MIQMIPTLNFDSLPPGAEPKQDPAEFDPAADFASLLFAAVSPRTPPVVIVPDGVEEEHIDVTFVGPGETLPKLPADLPAMPTPFDPATTMKFPSDFETDPTVPASVIVTPEAQALPPQTKVPIIEPVTGRPELTVDRLQLDGTQPVRPRTEDSPHPGVTPQAAEEATVAVTKVEPELSVLPAPPVVRDDLKRDPTMRGEVIRSTEVEVVFKKGIPEGRKPIQDAPKVIDTEVGVDQTPPVLSDDKVEVTREHERSSDLTEVILQKFTHEAGKRIDVAKSEPLPATHHTKLVEQVAPKIAELAPVDVGDRRLLKMRLHPAELGSVEVELERDPSGVVNARIHTESAAAQHILVEGLEQLRDSLLNSGCRVGQLNVESGLGSSAGDASGGDRNDGARASQPHTTQFHNEMSEEPVIARSSGIVSLRA